MVLLPSRLINLLAALLCSLLLAASFYLEHLQSLHPCSLCLLQRALFLLLAGVFLLAFFHNAQRRGAQIYGTVAFVFAVLGALLASRQVWLQDQVHAPATVCMPGFAYIVSHLPLDQALLAMLKGSDNCGVVDWRWWGWSIAHWSLLWFVLLGLLGFWQLMGLGYSKPLSPPK